MFLLEVQSNSPPRATGTHETLRSPHLRVPHRHLRLDVHKVPVFFVIGDVKFGVPRPSVPLQNLTWKLPVGE